MEVKGNRSNLLSTISNKRTVAVLCLLALLSPVALIAVTNAGPSTSGDSGLAQTLTDNQKNVEVQTSAQDSTNSTSVNVNASSTPTSGDQQSSSGSKVEVKVNGQKIEVPQNGSVNQTVGGAQNQNSVEVNVSSDSNGSNSFSSNSSSSFSSTTANGNTSHSSSNVFINTIGGQ